MKHLKKSYFIILIGIIVLLYNNCQKHISPKESIITPINTIAFSSSTETPTGINYTSTPTTTITPIDVSMQITKTCFSVDTCSAGGSAAVFVAEDANGYIWVTERTNCAYLIKYDANGNTLFSTTWWYNTDGMAADKTNNWIWFTCPYGNELGQSFVAFESNDNIGNISKAGFSFSKEIYVHYYGLAYDGQNLWTLKFVEDGINNKWYCCEYSTTGTLLKEFEMPVKFKSSPGNKITYGDGHLWVALVSSTPNFCFYLYKISITGEIKAIYEFTNFGFSGAQWKENNTFIAACGDEVCTFNF